MIRTQIYLPEDIHKRLLSLKSIKQKSLAQLIREAIEKHLVTENEDRGNDILNLSELNLSGGPKDLSSKMDQYLYGKE